MQGCQQAYRATELVEQDFGVEDAVRELDEELLLVFLVNAIPVVALAQELGSGG